MVSLARQQFLAVAKNKEVGNLNFVDIYVMKRVRARMPLFEKKNISEKKFTESE